MRYRCLALPRTYDHRERNGLRDGSDAPTTYRKVATRIVTTGWLIGQGTLPPALGKNVGETEGVNYSPEPVLIEVVAPSASAASQILRSYIDDVASRYYGDG